MASYVPVRGSTLLVPGTHYNPSRSHLCLVLNDPPDQNPKQTLFVPVITKRKKHDPTCFLTVGDHTFIKKESCVHYALSQIRSTAHLVKLIESGAITYKGQLSEEVLQRVTRGLLDSPFTPRFAKTFYGKFG